MSAQPISPKTALWNRYCAYYRYYPEVGLALDISRMRFPDSFFQQMAPQFQSAQTAMQKLEQGALANPDEGRMVGHYWLRTPEKSPNSEIKEEIHSCFKRIEEFAAKVHRGEIKTKQAEKFENILLVGIGGSALGPQLVSDAFWSPKNPLHIYFCDNTDPDGIQRTVLQLGAALRRTMVIVISKSGGTVETKNGQLEIAQAFSKAGIDFVSQAVAVTCQGSKLDTLAAEQKWLARFPMWDWVGGRTSLFSAVGLLPAALCGVNIRDFVEGARKMDELTRNPDPQTNPAQLLAAMWFYVGGGRGQKDMVVLPYKDRLVLFSKYLQQLVMESLGKEKDLSGNTVHQGIAVYGNKGSTDQHAYIQQLRDGVNNFFATFIAVEEDYSAASSHAGQSTSLEVAPQVTSGDYLRGFLLGTREALYENQRDSITITVDTLSPHTLGALIALYERAVGFYATYVNVNAYHQPGVEAGKKAAERVIDIQRKLLAALAKSGANSAGKTASELAVQIGEPDDAETAFFILEHLTSNSRGILREGKRSPQTSRYSLRSQ